MGMNLQEPNKSPSSSRPLILVFVYTVWRSFVSNFPQYTLWPLDAGWWVRVAGPLLPPTYLSHTYTVSGSRGLCQASVKEELHTKLLFRSLHDCITFLFSGVNAEQEHPQHVTISQLVDSVGRKWNNFDSFLSGGSSTSYLELPVQSELWGQVQNKQKCTKN